MTSTESRFLYNVIWSWLGVVVNVVLGLILSAILLRRLGVARYGVWVLLFSTILPAPAGFRLILRAAVINRCARHKARHEWTEVNETVDTAIVYFLMMSAACCLLALFGRHAAMSLSTIEPALQHDARVLMTIIALSVCRSPRAAQIFAASDGVSDAGSIQPTCSALANLPST